MSETLEMLVQFPIVNIYVIVYATDCFYKMLPHFKTLVIFHDLPQFPPSFVVGLVEGLAELL